MNILIYCSQVGMSHFNTLKILLVIPWVIAKYVNADESASYDRNQAAIDEFVASHISPCKPRNDGEMKDETSLFKESAVTVMDLPEVRGERIPCVDGEAGGYKCANVDLESFVPLRDLVGQEWWEVIGTPKANDLWGWTSPDTGIEYALVGMESGTSFVNLGDPENPFVAGFLKTHSVSSTWRDIKVYKNHAFIVSEATGHGMQVFDLTQLDGVTEFTDFSETAHYNGMMTAHNVAINEDSGYAYMVGGTLPDLLYCLGGLHIVDISDPTDPKFETCYSWRGYTHDAQCVIYDGPDTEHNGKEICFAANQYKLDIIDVSDKSEIKLLSSFHRVGFIYTHQGWITDDHKFFLIDDELDEQFTRKNTETFVCDITDLDAPKYAGSIVSRTKATDHNLYIRGQYTYQANYRAGLRVVDISPVLTGTTDNLPWDTVSVGIEVGYFDIYPGTTSNDMNGAWSVYPFFESDIIIVSGVEQGLFVLRPSGNFSDLPIPEQHNCVTNGSFLGMIIAPFKLLYLYLWNTVIEPERVGQTWEDAFVL